MKLHRAKSRPDWKTVNQRARNFWQQTAASTKGVVTPGNIISVTGFMMVIAGLVAVAAERYWLGFTILALGRLGDVLDGWLAEITGTKSPLGEAVDATLDKAGTFITLVVLFTLQIVPGWILLLLMAPHLIISLITLLALRRGNRPHPSRMGKNSMALAWVALIGFVLIAAINSSPGPLNTLIYGIAFISVVVGVMAAADYARLAYSSNTRIAQAESEK